MLEIRTYRDEDHDTVWALHNLALRDTGAHAGNGAWDDDLHDIPGRYLATGGAFRVGLLDGRIVAMGALLRLEPKRAEVKRMRVHPDCQRRGFGQAVLDDLLAIAGERGIAVLELDTTRRQVAAQALYEKNGFRHVSTRTVGPFEVLFYRRVV